MQIEKISAPLGARVMDIDVRQVDDSGWSQINDLFLEYHVLVFPGQTLTPEDQMAFASRWGPLVRHPYAGMKSCPDVIELRNFGKRKDVNQH
ncbi:MAG: TauD/TfdA family dioxygenase, partial [Pseudomonadales bacterium]